MRRLQMSGVDAASLARPIWYCLASGQRAPGRLEHHACEQNDKRHHYPLFLMRVGPRDKQSGRSLIPGGRCHDLQHGSLRGGQVIARSHRFLPESRAKDPSSVFPAPVLQWPARAYAGGSRKDEVALHIQSLPLQKCTTRDIGNVSRKSPGKWPHQLPHCYSSRNT